MRKILTATVTSATAFALACLAPAVTQAAPCDGVGAEQPFLQWHDQASYVLVSGGDFESAADGWTLSGGAEVVSGGNTLRPASSASSLSLPAGSSATTPATCVAKGDPVARIFTRTLAEGRRGPNSLKVEVLYLAADGSVRKVRKAGALHASGEWRPSRRFSLAQGQFGRPAKPSETGIENGGDHKPPTAGGEQGGPKPGEHGGGPKPPSPEDAENGGPKPRKGDIQLRFTPIAGSAWQIDDVFIDPRARA